MHRHIDELHQLLANTAFAIHVKEEEGVDRKRSVDMLSKEKLEAADQSV